MQARLNRMPDAMGIRRQTVEHPSGTFKSWMEYAFLTKTLQRVRTEMSLHILAYNMKRVIAIIAIGPLLRRSGNLITQSSSEPAATYWRGCRLLPTHFATASVEPGCPMAVVARTEAVRWGFSSRCK